MSDLFQFGMAIGTATSVEQFDPTALYDDVSVSPLFLYGTARFVSAYTGPAIRVLRPSDSAELDIDFDGNRLDETALFAFLGSETGKVLILYDQTGNGNHTTSQATDSYRLSVPLEIEGEYVRHNGNLVLLGADARYAIPTLTVNRQNYSFYTVGEFSGATIGLWQLGSTSDPYMEFASQKMNGAGTISPSLCLALMPAIFEMHSTPSGRAEAVNGDVRTRAASTNTTTTAGITMAQANASYGMEGFFSAAVGYYPGLSDANRTAIKAALSYAYSTPTAAPAYRVAFLGDSITFGLDATNNYGYAKKCSPLFADNVYVYADGASGRKLTEYSAGTVYDNNALKQIVADSTYPRCVVIFLGTNDFAALGSTGAEVYAAVETMANKVYADGVEYVIATTPLPRNDMTAGEASARDDYLTLIRADHSFVDGLIDLYADATMGGPDTTANDTDLYTDGVHPTDYGHSLVAQIMVTGIEAVVP